MKLQKEYDIIIVGGGPSGSMAAKYAAMNGVSVLVLEKDRDIGYPVRCGEAVHKEGLEEFIEIDPKWIASTISNFRLVSPDGTEVKLNFNRTGYIVERKLFDYALSIEASKYGAEFLTRAYVYDLIWDDGKVAGVKFEQDGESKEIKSKVVIGADGVESRVGRWAGMKSFTKFRDMECCVQITATNLPDLDTSSCYFYFGENVAPGGYLWVFPKGKNTANIGLGIGGDKAKIKSPIRYLNEFIEAKFSNISQLTKIAGGVPCAITHKEIVKNNVMLVGDAAQQVNPLSGGGIITGMLAGSIAGRIAAESIKKNNYSILNDYPKEWYERKGKSHESYYKIKNGIYKFTDEKLNKIAHSAVKIPEAERTLKQIFKIALYDNPALIIDIAKLILW